MSRGRSRNPGWIVLGGGLCGLTAARYLRRGWHLFEAGERVGGVAQTERIEGHRFDRTGHWLHLRDAGIRQLARRLLGDSLVAVDRVSRIFSHGVLTRYPFQANLHGLPPEVVYECLSTFLDRRPRRPAHPGRTWRSFEEFILEHFGEGIARHFMLPYNEKLWGVHPREITDAWCRRFVPIPDRDAVLRGAVGFRPPELGYNAQFLYPRRGGIEVLPQALAGTLPPERIHTRAPVERIDHHRRQVRVGDEWWPYRALVATAPLPELCRLLAAPPQKVVAAAERLRWTPVRYLSVGLRRRTPQRYHWVYVPEPRWPAYRVGVYTNAAPSMAPRRGASLYVELASRGREREQTLVRQTLPLLQAAGALRDPEDLRFARLRHVEYAYVVFDRHYERARRTLLDFFESYDIYPRGRYGSWDYGSMEDAMVQGRDVAKMLRSRYKKNARPRRSH